MKTTRQTASSPPGSLSAGSRDGKIREMSRQIERFSEICAAILSISDMDDFFDRISEAVVDISDYRRVLISFFTDQPPFREIIGYKGISRQVVERVGKVEMPREKYQEIFKNGIPIGNQSCFIPNTMKGILDQDAVIFGESDYPPEGGHWHKEDNLLIAMKDKKGSMIGTISVDESKSGMRPTKETVRPLEIFANLITESIQKKMLETRIRQSEEKYRDLLSNIMVGVIRATPEGRLQEANPSAVKMFGYKQSASFLKQKFPNLFSGPEDAGEFLNRMEKPGSTKNFEIRLKTKTGRLFWASISAQSVKDRSGKILHFDAVVEDITERKKLEEDVRRLSVTDELTGLYNRRYFNMNLPKEIRLCEKWSSSLSLIMVDIDDFKVFNDTYHHLKGDEVIQETARVILRNIRKHKDWASRFGGDEFVLVLPGIDAEKAQTVAERIRETFQSTNFRPQGEIVQKSISLGIADCSHGEAKALSHLKLRRLQPSDHETIATELIRLADMALFKAKRSGKNKIIVARTSIELCRTGSRAERAAPVM